MAVTNPGDPISTLRNALDAYTTVQDTMIAEAAKLKPPQPAEQPGGASSTQTGATGAVPA